MICTLLLLACNDKGPDTDGPADDTSPTTDDTQVETGDPPDDTGDTDTEEPEGDWVKTATEKGSWAEAYGYEVATYTLSEAAADQYDSLYDGERPTFYMVRPVEPDASREYPVLAWFHGGTIGDDSKEVPDACSQENVTDFAYGAAFDPHFVPRWVADREWVMVIPRNDWCDAWQGMGVDDPVDPEHHFGYYHAARALDWVRADESGLKVSDDLYGWGTSAGAHGVTTFAARYGNFDSIIFDSGIGSMFMYYTLNDQAAGRHIFGGDPYTKSGDPNGDIWQRYADSSPYYLVGEAGFDVPMFVPWNSQDTLVQDTQIGSLLDAIGTTWDDTARWGSHDYNHKAPGTLFHVQSVYGFSPWGYFGNAYLDFLEGKNLHIVEAEDGCAVGGQPCNIGEVITDNEIGSAYAAFSGATVRESGIGEAGTLYSGRVPSEVPAGASVKAYVAMRGDNYDGIDGSQEFGAIQYTENATVAAATTLTVGDLSPEVGATDQEMVAQYHTTAVEFTAGKGTDRYVTVISAGRIVLAVDAVLFTW